MTCKNLTDCAFLDKFSGSMPHTTNMVKLTYCTDNNRCVIKKLSTTVIVFIEDDRLPVENDKTELNGHDR
jgi:hypothetical protein